MNVDLWIEQKLDEQLEQYLDETTINQEYHENK